MPNNPYGTTATSCKMWLYPGDGINYHGQIMPDLWLGASGAQVDNNGNCQTAFDKSGNSNSATQSTAAQGPFISGWNRTSESECPCLRFMSQFTHNLPIPSGVTIGGGSPTNEATIIFCIKYQPGNNGFIWSDGSIGLWQSTDATSTTTLTIGTGSKTLTIQTGMPFATGMTVEIQQDSSHFMVGTITSYNSGTGSLVVNATASTGSGSTSGTLNVFPCNGADHSGSGGVAIQRTGPYFPTIYNGSNHPFPTPYTSNTFGPTTMALRFKSGETKLYVGQNYTDTLSTNYLSGSASGGSIGSLSTTSFCADFDLYDFMIFNQAISDADVHTAMKGMQDRVSPNEGTMAQILFFGDSRTQGYQGTSGQFPVTNRAWPGRLKSMLGGAGQVISCATIGETIDQQIARLSNYLPLLNSSVYSKRIVIGEVGVNDIDILSASAATVQASLTTLANLVLASNATQLVIMTIAPALSQSGPQNTVRTTVNSWLTGGGIPGAIILDNASDARLNVAGYYSDDQLHWNDPGLGVYAENAYNVVKQLLFNSGYSAVL